MWSGISSFYLHEYAIIKNNQIIHSLKPSELAFRYTWHWIKIYLFKKAQAIDESHYIANIKGSQKRYIEHSSNLKTLHIWGGYHRVKKMKKKPSWNRTMHVQNHHIISYLHIKRRKIHSI